MYNISIFIFRNDLRLEDNTALIESLKNSKTVIPIFIFNKKQITPQNKYRSLNSMQFLKQSLKDLNKELKKHNSKLYLFYDEIENIILKLKKELNVDSIYINKDYTPFAKKRDNNIKQICKKNSIDFHEYNDKLLLIPENSLKPNQKPYTIFTPFYKKNSLHEINYPKKNNYKNYYKDVISFSIEKFPKEFDYENENVFIKGGRNNALKIMKKHIIKLNNYETEKNYPSTEKTSKLSAHLKFGTISVRELYYFIKENLNENHPLLRQLYWRDFFYTIGYFFPHVFGKCFNKKYDKIKWENDKTKFEKWKNGKTGFPIIDAAMRQLNQTGYMHNRARMIVSSFLVKDLHINWREGEKYFAQKLVDYDPSLNNGNWQWAASTGCDAQPYFRIFNPWLQQKKFDIECKYIKKYVPELKKLTSKQIHNIENMQIQNYSKPIIDHSTQSKISKEIYKQC